MSPLPATDSPVQQASLSADRKARVRNAFDKRTRSFTELARVVRESGLNDRTPWFYAVVLAVLLLALGGAGAGIVLLGHSWLQLLVAGGLGVVFTQIAFVGHEAAHRQVFKTGPANDRLGRVLADVFVGISYSWWMTKHTRHHGNPNQMGKDPDIALGTVAFTVPDAEQSRGPRAWLIRRQGLLFLPLLLLEGLELHLTSLRSLLRDPRQGRFLEFGVIIARFAVYLGLLFWLLPVGMAFAFLGVQLAVFGFYMGASFAPNHVAMPIVPADARLDFLDKQVLTSRNITGGWWMTALMGGLNYQIEHHLFPGMPRPQLSRTRRLVREHCRAHGVKYTQTSLPAAWVIIIRYLNEVGLAAGRHFSCPAAGAMGRS